MTQNISKVFTSAQIFYLSEHRNTKKSITSKNGTGLIIYTNTLKCKQHLDVVVREEATKHLLNVIYNIIFASYCIHSDVF